MRGLVAATAVLGVIAIGGLPVLALTLADAESGSTGSAGSTTLTEANQRPGPPPWAHGRDGKDAKPAKPAKPDKSRGDDRTDEQGEQDAQDAQDEDSAEVDGRPGWSRRGDQVPPGWAKHHPGRAPHGWAMREWAQCVAGAAAQLPSGEKLDPEAACGVRPQPPGGSERTR